MPKSRRCPSCAGRQVPMFHYVSDRPKSTAIWKCQNCGRTDPREDLWSKARRGKLAARLRELAEQAESEASDQWVLDLKSEIKEINL